MAHNINETEVELPTHAILTPPPSKQISDTRERPFSWFLLATACLALARNVSETEVELQTHASQ